jgi:hypothetical protein
LFTEGKTVLIVIEEIEKALEAERFLSALALALTLPDICGRAAAAAPKSTGKQYVAWYDAHITPYYEPDFPELGEYPKFDGVACYKLRCTLLHSAEMPAASFDTFELTINRPVCGVYSGGLRGYTWPDGDEPKKKSRVRVDIAGLAFRLCQAARVFYEEKREELDFGFANFEVIDMDARFDRLRKTD